MKYNFIRLRIKNISPHTSDQISFQIQTCIVGYGKDHQLIESIMKWINQIPTDEVNVHIVEIKDMIREIVLIVSNLLLYPILIYFII